MQPIKFSTDLPPSPGYVSKYHLLAFGFMTLFNHVATNWSQELKAGIGYQIIFNILSTLTFAIFYSCISELTSALPFPGGSYAFTRCTVGFFPGYIVGSFEMLYYIMQFAFTNAAIVGYVRPLSGFLHKYALLVLLLVIFSEVGFCVSKRVMYNSLVVLASISFIICCIYVFGGASEADFSKWAYIPTHTDDDVLEVFIEDDDGSYLPIDSSSSTGVLFSPLSMRVLQSISPCLWMYKGLEFVNLMCDDVTCPRTTIPFAQLASFAVYAMFITIMPIVGTSMYPGAERLSKLASATAPGLGNIFHLRHRLAVLILLPVLYGNALVSLYGFTKLVGAMAESKLFPKILARKYWRTKTNVFALGLGCIISMIAITIPSLISDHIFVAWSFVLNFFAFVTYIVQLIGYCILQVKLREIPRDYESPFGLWGAIFAIFMFLLGIASTIAGKVRVVVTLEVATVCFVVLTLYYYFYAMRVQTFSEAEKKVMLPVHVQIRNANEYLYTKYPILGAIVSCCYPNRQRKLLENEKQHLGGGGSSSDSTGAGSDARSLCCYCLCNKTVPVNNAGDGASRSVSDPVWKIRAQDYPQDNIVVSINNNSNSSSAWLPPAEENEDGALAQPPIKLRPTKQKLNHGICEDNKELEAGGQASFVNELFSPTVNGSDSRLSRGSNGGNSGGGKDDEALVMTSKQQAAASTIVNMDNDYEDDDDDNKDDDVNVTTTKVSVVVQASDHERSSEPTTSQQPRLPGEVV